MTTPETGSPASQDGAPSAEVQPRTAQPSTAQSSTVPRPIASSSAGGLSPDPSETPAEAEADAAIGSTVAALTADDLEPAGRRKLLGRLVEDVRRRGLGQLFRPKAAMRWMADVVGDVAPHVPVRDRETLLRHFDNLPDDDLAERLIRNAARATAGVGAAGGGVASIEWAVTPTLLSAPGLPPAHNARLTLMWENLVRIASDFALRTGVADGGAPGGADQ